MGALDFSGRQQLYYQLYNLLFQDIISGKSCRLHYTGGERADEYLSCISGNRKESDGDACQ